MTRDENESALFFREAALRICGHLEAHQGLARCFELFRTRLPVDRMFLETFDPGAGAMRTVASADARGGRPHDTLSALSPLARASIEAQTGAAPAHYMFNEARVEPVAVDMYRHHGIDLDAAGLLVVLGELDAPLGGLVLISERARYTPAHVDIVVPLRELFAIALSNALEHREVVRLGRLLVDENRYLKDELDASVGADVIGSDGGLRDVMAAVNKVAPTDSVVLLLGETGVGKDVLARALHRLSLRKEGPFVTVDCGAIAESLIDSELFGHDRGAFTGADRQRRGRFERAEGGTLFLDEIGELTPAAQVRLLRALQNHEIERVGGTEPIPIDARIVAATHRSLEVMVKEGRFREDLWYRLNVFPIRVPPLRERLEDIPPLVRHFVDAKTRELKLGTAPRLERGALVPLESYGWPGNVRELEHVVERALILGRGNEVLHFRDALGTVGAHAQAESLNLDDVVRRHIRRVLDLTDGQIEGPEGAAARMGLNASTLRSRMRRLGIERR